MLKILRNARAVPEFFENGYILLPGLRSEKSKTLSSHFNDKMNNSSFSRANFRQKILCLTGTTFPARMKKLLKERFPLFAHAFRHLAAGRYTPLQDHTFSFNFFFTVVPKK